MSINIFPLQMGSEKVARWPGGESGAKLCACREREWELSGCPPDVDPGDT